MAGLYSLTQGNVVVWTILNCFNCFYMNAFHPLKACVQKKRQTVTINESTLV